MVHIANLTDAQAFACAQKMLDRNRLHLAHQIINAVNARNANVPPKRVRKPRRRHAQTGELI